MDPAIMITEIVRNLKEHWVFRGNDPFKHEGRYAILRFDGVSDSFPMETPEELWDEEECTLLAFIEIRE